MSECLTKVLVIGGGAREHALVNKLRQDGVKDIFCSPGNAGTEQLATNVVLDLRNNEAILEFVEREQIDLTIVGPEEPLSRGIVDAFQAAGKLIIGPTKAAARLETSKVFARRFMSMYKIPQPDYYVCEDIEDAQNAAFIFKLPLVLKVDGLAAGKGALVCRTDEEWLEALRIVFTEKKFGSASDQVLVEQCISGEELSVFVLSDGYSYGVIGTAQDHKRLLDGDLGPNTGGMGAYSPTLLATDELMVEIKRRIIEPTLLHMAQSGFPYQGFLYIGLMVTESGPQVIEFNARLGDPEAQVILPLIESSFYELLYQVARVDLRNPRLEFKKGFAVSVVKVAGGYPNKYSSGEAIIGLPPGPVDYLVHAGTRKNLMGAVVTSGGRVLNFLGFGEDLESAIADAYIHTAEVHFADEFYRRDIGRKGLIRSLTEE